MSKRPYECFRCRDNGYPDTMIYLAGKDSSGKTVYVEEDGAPHQHKLKQQEQEESKPQPKISGIQTEQDNNPLAPVSDESVNRGISAFSMMCDLIRLVEQTQKLLVSMDGKLDRLLNLAERK